MLFFLERHSRPYNGRCLKSIISQKLDRFYQLRIVKLSSAFSLHPAEAVGTNHKNPHKKVHITDISASVHWLPLHFRIDLKFLIITFEACLGLVPDYITGLLTPYEPDCRLREKRRPSL